MIVELPAHPRSKMGKATHALRAQGVIPGVMYGPKQVSTPVEMLLRDFSKVLEKAGESSVVNLSIDGKEHNVLIYEVDRDPVTDIPRHVDFYAIVKGQKVKVHIPLVFSGESAAVKEGANLVKALHEIEVEADPMHLPHELVADVSILSAIGMQLTAKDIALPEGVSLVTDANDVVATILAAKEEVEEVVAAPDMTTIGISEERGKKEEAAPVSGAAPAPEAKSEGGTKGGGKDGGGKKEK